MRAHALLTAAFLLTFVFAVGDRVQAQTCVEYDEYVRPVSSWIGGRDIAVVGNWGVSVNQAGGAIETWDLADPLDPQLIGSLSGTSSNQFLRVGVWGDYAYVIEEDYGLRIANIANLSGPFWVGEEPQVLAHRIHVDNGHAFVASTNGALQVYDVAANPPAPDLVDGMLSEWPIADVFVEAGVAYLAKYQAGVELVDVSNPSAISSLRVVDTDGAAYAAVPAHGRVYVATNAGLEIIDLSTDPAFSMSVTPIPSESGRADLDLISGYALYSRGDDVSLVYVNNPWDPDVLSSFPGWWEDSGILPDGQHVHTGGVLYALGNRTAIHVDSGLTAVAPALALHERDDVLLHLTNDAVRSFGISIPDAPTPLDDFALPGGLLGSDVVGSYVLIAQGSGGVEVIDVADPSNMRFHSIIAPPAGASSVEDIHVVGTTGYMVLPLPTGFNPDVSDLVRIYDLSNIDQPAEIGQFGLSISYPFQIYALRAEIIAPHYALFQMRYYDGAHPVKTKTVVVDLSDPSTPVEIAEIPDLFVDSLVGYGDFIYGVGPGIHTIDFSDPSSATVVESIAGAGTVGGAGAGALYVGESGQIRVVDVSAPPAPIPLGVAFMVDEATELLVADGMLYGSSPWVGLFWAPLQCDPTVPPVANFSGTPTSGEAPLTVQFTDLSSGGPTSWSWDFGDGHTSTIPSPSHTYTAAGSFTVTLTATNSGGSDVVVGRGGPHSSDSLAAELRWTRCG